LIYTLTGSKPLCGFGQWRNVVDILGRNYIRFLKMDDINQDNYISKMTGYRLHDRGSYPRKAKGCFSLVS
jgi:hypothetical protein